ncbi:MAG: ATP-grasp domain-containing protein [Gammaproteobacteria bacterium]
MSLTWLFEPYVLPELHERMRASARHHGFQARAWDDCWLESWPPLDEDFVVFHGSLATAATIRENSPWEPGAYCNVRAFECSAWYSQSRTRLLHREWSALTVQELVDDPARAFARFGSPESLFVRPDSALKPFAGRVIQREAVNLRALDHGFYFNDTSTNVVLAPVRKVGREWRYVVVDGRVVAGSAYTADSRAAMKDDPRGSPWQFADAIARELPSPDVAYVLDVCESDGELWLLELNPFSGADLYACDTDDVVEAIGQIVMKG